MAMVETDTEQIETIRSLMLRAKDRELVDMNIRIINGQMWFTSTAEAFVARKM